MRRLVTLVAMGIALMSAPAAAQRRVQPRVNYSNFSHSTHVTDKKLACSACHKVPTKNWKEVRKGDAAFPDVTEFPEHESCLNCHRQQFFARERPVPQICSNCHVKGTPVDTSRHVFPSLSKAATFVSEFRVLFPHDKHSDADCADCHQNAKPQGKETSKTKPIAHAMCFTCHNQESELAPLPANCDTCHKQAASEKLFAHAVLVKPAAETDFSQFKHDDRNHARLPCLLCHRRENNSPQPTLPGKASHTPCTGCHAQQFANSASVICTICHTDVQSGKVKAFPALRSFDARFDHAKHREAACATCHRRNRGGIGLSIPSRANAHVTCFSCHTPNAQANGRNISSCSTCHQLGRLVRTSEQAPAYRVGFSHTSHDASEKLGCAACHQVRGKQVSAPLALNHHARAGAFSCASCHNGERTFGGDDFSVCKRCHKGSAWHF
ncbi:MAG TPA: cytochrome c3 family protein [Pyrinomonadaceae bacterium]|nr:cytochrome c3 family protein [Pyrinomonadaceae bacterium]